MQTRSLSRLLTMASSATADLPVWRSPMISSRCPRPMAVMASIALMPVSIGSSTGLRWTTPGALNSAGRYSATSISPLPSSGLPSGSRMRPSRPSPTGIWSRRSVRLTVSPSSILSHSPNSTAPTLSDSRLSARPVTSCGSSSISIDMQLSRPWRRAIPSAIERTVPTSDRSAPPSSSPSMRLLRMLVISSGLIFIQLPLSRGRGHFSSQSLQPTPHRSVHDQVADAHRDASDGIGVDRRLELRAPACLLLDPLADRVDEVVVELDGAPDRNRQHLVLPLPELVELLPDPEQHGHPVPLGEELQEADEALVRALDDPADRVLLLLRGEVRREEEHLELPVPVERVRELAELVVDPVEDVVLLGDLEQRAGVDLGDLLH